MSYRRADKVLPMEILKLIQEYVDGECLYIPRKEVRREWGSTTGIRQELSVRNESIYLEYQNGLRVPELAERFCLSEKSIQRILYQMKRKMETG